MTDELGTYTRAVSTLEGTTDRRPWRGALLAGLLVGLGVAALVAARARTVDLVVHNASSKPIWIEVGQVQQALGGRGSARLPELDAGSELAHRGLYESPEALKRTVAPMPGALSRSASYVWNVGGEGTLWVVARTYGGEGKLAGRSLGSPTLLAVPAEWEPGIDVWFPAEIRAKRGQTPTLRGVFSESWLKRKGLLDRLAALDDAGDPSALAVAATERRRLAEPLLGGLLFGLLALVCVRAAPRAWLLARAGVRRVDLSKASHQKALAAALIAMFVSLNVVSAWHKSRTYDEGAHLTYGSQVLAGDASRTHSSVVPMTALNALPGRLALSLPDGGLKTALLTDRAARLPTMMIGGLLCGMVFLWTRALYGFPAALLALVLAGFAPNLQGHARWVATDLYSAASVVFASWTLWRFLRRPGWLTASVAGIALGLAQVAKLSGVLLYPTVVLVLGLRWWFLRHEPSRHAPRRWVGWGLLALALHLVVLNAAYRFQGSGAALDDYTFESQTLSTWKGRIGPFARLPLPLPSPYLEGVDDSKHNAETSVKGRSNNYLLGEVRQERFASYYLVAVLVKVPLIAQLLFWLALARLALARDGRSFARRELFLLAPIVIYGITVTCFSSLQIGIRHLLVVLPLGHVLCGSLLERWSAWGPRQRLLLAAGIAWLIVSVLSWFPHTMSYFNELIFDRKRASDVLADSNLDWGQNRRFVQDYLDRNPDVVRDPAAPRAGRVLIGVNRLCGVFIDDRLDWHRTLRTTLDPIDHVGYTHLVYRIPPERVAQLQGTGN